MAIKAIIFDFFGVLVVPGKDVLYQDYPQHQDAIHDLRLQCDHGYISHEEFSSKVAGLVGMPVQNLIDGYWSKNVRDERAFEWLRNTRKDTTRQIALLSNIGRGWLDDFIPITERTELFDIVVLSNEIGIMKPDARAYNITAERLGVLPEECVMIDDSASNIEGAKHAGMQGVIFESVDQAGADLVRILESSRA
ncbi:MAG TPA: HAD-IA family hydrolase [Candidatus Saccharimonadales bacterium]|nr:HAD-IA family hydrolase [Candidatus Saccharimonadales bacterium]